MGRDFVNGDDVRVVETGRGARLLGEAADTVLVAQLSGWEQLNGDEAVEGGVAGLVAADHELPSSIGRKRGSSGCGFEVDFGEREVDIEGLDMNGGFQALIAREQPAIFRRLAEYLDSRLVLGDEEVFFKRRQAAIKGEFAAVIVARS